MRRGPTHGGRVDTRRVRSLKARPVPEKPIDPNIPSSFPTTKSPTFISTPTMSSAASRKRKAAVSSDDDDYAELIPPVASTSKRAKTSTSTSYAPAITLMRRVLADRENFDVPSGENEMRSVLVQLAEYAQDLESKSKSGAAAASASAPATKSKAEINSAAEKLKRACVSQITKQRKVGRGSTLLPILFWLT
jgi:hypothetical protein